MQPASKHFRLRRTNRTPSVLRWLQHVRKGHSMVEGHAAAIIIENGMATVSEGPAVSYC